MKFSLVLVVVTIMSISCVKKRTINQIQPEASGLIKNIPENTDAKDFVVDPHFDVYALGKVSEPNRHKEGYWKNGVWNQFPDDFDPNGIFEDASHFYMYGAIRAPINDVGSFHAVYYMDGNLLQVNTDKNQNSEVVGLAVVGGKTISCGYEIGYGSDDSKAVGLIWENQIIKYRLPGIHLRFLKIVNGDIYTAGYYETISNDIVHAHNVFYKNGELISTTPSDYGYCIYDINYQRSVNTGTYETYFINTTAKKKPEFNPGNFFQITAMNLTPDNTLLIGGVCTTSSDDITQNPVDDFSNCKQVSAGILRDGLYDRLESRYFSEVTDIKTSNSGKEFIAGNIFYSAVKSISSGIESDAVLWIDNERYKLTGPYKYTYVTKLFIREK